MTDQRELTPVEKWAVAINQNAYHNLIGRKKLPAIAMVSRRSIDTMLIDNAKAVITMHNQQLTAIKSKVNEIKIELDMIDSDFARCKFYQVFKKRSLWNQYKTKKQVYDTCLMLVDTFVSIAPPQKSEESL